MNFSNYLLTSQVDPGFRIIPNRHLRPYQERERGSGCVNLSAVERNRQRRAEASNLHISTVDRVIYCAPHMVEEIRRAIEARPS